ncbi:MAG: PEP-CTERM sorting domain-containing protein, partial [Terrimicrobiaceae bacterium]
PNGNLVGQGSWVQTGTTATNPIQVTSSAAIVNNSGQDVYKAFSGTVPATAATSIYSVLDVTVTAAAAGGDYFAHLSDPVGTTSNFYQRLFIQSATGGFRFGILETSGAGGTTDYGTTVLSFNTPYRVVVAWNFVAGALNDTQTIYIDPTDAIPANNTVYATTTWTTSTAEPAQLTAANLRQSSASYGANVDLFRVTDDFSLAVVPEPSTCLLLGVGLGFTLLRLRRRQVA